MIKDDSVQKKYIIALLAAVFMAYLGESIYGYIFNNYLEDVHHIGAEARGFLEFPRELPGILALFAVGALYFLRENSIAAIAALILGGGILTLAIPEVSASYSFVVAIIMLASLGQHIFMVIIDAIVIHSVKPENRSVRLGQMRALITAAGLGGSLYIWAKWKYINKNFSVDFIVAGSLCILAAILFMALKTKSFPVHKSWKERFVFKKRYSLYYWLEIFFGARKQVFVTFGFWVMVAVLGKSPIFIGKVMLVAGIIGIFFKPFVGKLVQRFGEKKVLMADSVMLFVICMGYAFALNLFAIELATIVICACFIVDNLLFAAGTARSSYIARISESKEDITPSLYSGMAINHVTSILAAILGGFIWHWTGTHIWAFVLAAIFAVFSGITASKIKA